MSQCSKHLDVRLKICFFCKTTIFAKTAIDWPSCFEAYTKADVNPLVYDVIKIGNKNFEVSVLKVHKLSNFLITKSSKETNFKLESNLKCNQCPYKTDRTFNLDSHVRKKHLSTKIVHKCVSCGATYERKDHFEKHRRKCKKDENFQIISTNQTNGNILAPVEGGCICRVCGYRTFSAPHFARHGEIHDRPSSFPCLQCPKSFTKKGWLSSHVQKLHSQTVPEQTIDSDQPGTDNVTLQFTHANIC